MFTKVWRIKGLEESGSLTDYTNAYGESPFNLSDKQLNLQHLDFILLLVIDIVSSTTYTFTRLLLRLCVGCPKQHLLKLS